MAKKGHISIRFVLILIIAAIVSFSCTKTIEGNLPVAAPQLVVDANIETNVPPMVMLTQTVSVFGSDLNNVGSFFMHNADVWVKDKTTGDSIQLIEYCLNDLPFDSTTKTQILHGFGFSLQDSTIPNVCLYSTSDAIAYFTGGTTSFHGQVFHDYSLTVDVDTFHSYGETSIVQPIAPDSLGYEPLPAPNDTLVNLYVYINVPSDLGHFVRYWTKRNQESYYAPDPSVWDDKLFTGSTLKLPIFRGYGNDKLDSTDQSGYFLKGDTVSVKWANIDYQTFNFFNTLENDGSGSPFSTQVKVQSNMSGAIGVFAGYSTSYLSLVIPPQ